ncbi:MAG: 30S ribosomal protein S2 [Candidatus Pacebacteria bacterium]|nr:30S ribosomal protein S2 [Candidatus Paceibacterota bacterium]
MEEEKTKISMMDMLKAGVHFGHKKSKKHPKMDEYVFGVRNGISIIDLSKTKGKLAEAADFARKISEKDGIVLFVGTKRQASKIIEAAAKKCEMPYVSERWLGGTFTNFDKILIGKKRLESLVEQKESGELERKYTKKEVREIEREMKRLEIKFGGIRKVNRIPDAVFVVDIIEEETAILEAAAKKVPIIAITDTNTNPIHVNYPIPANDDAIRSIELITNVIANAIIEGKKK